MNGLIISAYIFAFLIVVVGIIFMVLYFTNNRPFCVERGIECEEDIECCDSKYFECRRVSSESGKKLCLYNNIIDNDQTIVLFFEGDYNEYRNSPYPLENSIKKSLSSNLDIDKTDIIIIQSTSEVLETFEGFDSGGIVINVKVPVEVSLDILDKLKEDVGAISVELSTITEPSTSPSPDPDDITGGGDTGGGDTGGEPAPSLQPCDGVVCDAASGQCKVAGICQPSSGQCTSETNVKDGTPCDDGEADTINDVCASGICAGSPTPSPEPLDPFLDHLIGTWELGGPMDGKRIYGIPIDGASTVENTKATCGTRGLNWVTKGRDNTLPSNSLSESLYPGTQAADFGGACPAWGGHVVYGLGGAFCDHCHGTWGGWSEESAVLGPRHDQERHILKRLPKPELRPARRLRLLPRRLFVLHGRRTGGHEGALCRAVAYLRKVFVKNQKNSIL